MKDLLQKFKPGWRGTLGAEFEKEYMKHIDWHLSRDQYFPDRGRIFRVFCETDIPEVRVVIVGQDPYPRREDAIGRAFSLDPLSTKVPRSLKKVFQALEMDEFKGSETSTDFQHWVDQGVFLLNRCLTYMSPIRPKGKSPHLDIGWQTFTNRAVEILASANPRTIFMLWGDISKELIPFIPSSERILTSEHPVNRWSWKLPPQERFVNCHHFSQANNLLGSLRIDWKLPSQRQNG